MCHFCVGAFIHAIKVKCRLACVNTVILTDLRAYVTAQTWMNRVWYSGHSIDFGTEDPWIKISPGPVTEKSVDPAMIGYLIIQQNWERLCL